MLQNQMIINPKISVVIPVYNMGEYLPQCLDSVIGQTLYDIEIICVDDGSTDNSHEILLKYQEKDKRIIIVTQENAGAGPARNNGINHSSGEFVAFMDPDDWYPDTDILETLYNTAKKEGVKICGGVNCIWDKKYFIGNYNGRTDILSYNQYGYTLLKDHQIAHGYLAFIYNLSWLKSENIYFPPYKRGQDPAFFAKALISANEYYTINKVTYCYRKEHKIVHWDVEKKNDYLKNIIDLLRMSRDNNLEYLHLDTIGELQGWCLTTWHLRLFQNNLELPNLLTQANQLIEKELVYSALSSRIIPIALFKTHNYATPFARACTLLSCSFTLFIILCHRNGLNYTLCTIIRKIY